MDTNKNTTKVEKVRAFLRYAWDDQVRAHRALLRYPAYDEYLFDHRNGR